MNVLKEKLDGVVLGTAVVTLVSGAVLTLAMRGTNTPAVAEAQTSTPTPAPIINAQAFRAIDEGPDGSKLGGLFVPLQYGRHAPVLVLDQHGTFWLYETDGLEQQYRAVEFVIGCSVTNPFETLRPEPLPVDCSAKEVW